MDDDLEALREMRRKRGNEEPKMDITPMIDVTFLLLIFFIVASRLDPQMVVEMAKAKHGTAVPESESVVIVVTHENPDEPKIYKGATREASALIEGTPEEQDAQITEYVQQELEGGKKKFVLIKAEKRVKYRHMDRIYKAIKAGLTDQNLNVAIIEKT